MLYDTEQVAAFETMDRGRGIPGFEFQAVLRDAFALGKSVREDLVEHGIFNPVGRYDSHGMYPFR
jgi:hypothetical protein